MKAKKKLEWYKVLPPEEGHPDPYLGARLMFKAKVKGRTKWVCFMIGNNAVMTRFAERANKALNGEPSPEEGQITISRLLN